VDSVGGAVPVRSARAGLILGDAVESVGSVVKSVTLWVVLAQQALVFSFVPRSRVAWGRREVDVHRWVGERAVFSQLNARSQVMSGRCW